jgi:hypothetical protein
MAKTTAVAAELLVAQFSQWTAAVRTYDGNRLTESLCTVAISRRVFSNTDFDTQVLRNKERYRGWLQGQSTQYRPHFEYRHTVIDFYLL